MNNIRDKFSATSTPSQIFVIIWIVGAIIVTLIVVIIVAIIGANGSYPKFIKFPPIAASAAHTLYYARK